jgi:hypothetical protein
VHQLAVLSRQVEDTLQCRQLAIDFAVGVSPFLSIVALAEDHHVLLALQDERVDVGGRNRDEPPTFEVGEQMEPDSPLELITRAPAVDRVFGLQILGGFVERIRFSFGFTGRPCAMSPSRILRS